MRLQVTLLPLSGCLNMSLGYLQDSSKGEWTVIAPDLPANNKRLSGRRQLFAQPQQEQPPGVSTTLPDAALPLRAAAASSRGQSSSAAAQQSQTSPQPVGEKLGRPGMQPVQEQNTGASAETRDGGCGATGLSRRRYISDLIYA